MSSPVTQAEQCYHCGEDCDHDHPIKLEEKSFCCEGCKTVYQVLNNVQLCDYYRFSEKPGISQKNAARKDKFVLLDDETIKEKLIHFKDETQSHVTFYLPQMHCSSCIWLLENLKKLNSHVISSRVNFLKKEVTIVFDHNKTSLREMAELCNHVGYEPHISLNDLGGKKIKKYNRARIYKIGIAGFCFGNVMLLSFPEYFSFGQIEEKQLAKMFAYLNLFLALPVFFYSASEFFVSAWKGLKQKFLNIDAPIALAVLITFGRSVFEILTESGAGYLDSMTGIVFFMLIGRFFQDKTYNTLTFNRDYTSYFPLGVTVIEESGDLKQIPVSELKAGQRIKVHSHEIIPADSILFLGKASIDYSFVTGESLPVDKGIGEIVYAGGRQMAGALELEVVKEVSQSYLTQLWNNETFAKDKTEEKPSFVHKLSRQFTVVLFSIALASATYWWINDPSKILHAVTSILIVACPCSLLLSATFTNGNVLKVLQNFGFYVRNSNVLERINEADTIVFDKTGTITAQEGTKIQYNGLPVDAELVQSIRSLAYQSSHPLSKAIVSYLPASKILPVRNFHEIKGKGLSGILNGKFIRLGSAEFVNAVNDGKSEGSKVYLSVDAELIGFYSVKIRYREGLQSLITKLLAKFNLNVLSGDNNSEEHYLRRMFGENTALVFNQQPQQKLDFVKGLQNGGRKVIMVGDGLNDAGALRQSDAGIAVTDNVNNFSPACDVILEGKSFGMLDLLLDYCKSGKRIIIYSFILSILYNIVGLYFAFFGLLKPVIAAILMPASSISIILFTTGMSALLSWKMGRRQRQLT
jgi:P-type Cu+ transporter